MPGKHCYLLFLGVDTQWQGKGIGTFMMERLIAIGRDRGIKVFTAEVMTSNAKMLDIFYRTGLEVKTTLVEDTYMVRIDLFQQPAVNIDKEGV